LGTSGAKKGTKMATHLMLDDLAPTPGYAHVVVAHPEEHLVLTAGAVPLDVGGDLVGERDLEAQTRQVLLNLEGALAAVGSGLSSVVKSTVYVVAESRADLSRVWALVRDSGLSDGPHSSTLLGVSLLGYPGQLVEIEAIAVTNGRHPA